MFWARICRLRLRHISFTSKTELKVVGIWQTSKGIPKLTGLGNGKEVN